MVSTKRRSKSPSVAPTCVQVQRTLTSPARSIENVWKCKERYSGVASTMFSARNVTIPPDPSPCCVDGKTLSKHHSHLHCMVQLLTPSYYQWFVLGGGTLVPLFCDIFFYSKSPASHTRVSSLSQDAYKSWRFWSSKNNSPVIDLYTPSLLRWLLSLKKQISGEKQLLLGDSFGWCDVAW